MRGWLFILIGMLVLSGCEDILGIEERGLDTAELTSAGYEGCEPSDAVCDGCTSDWHRCICDGWKKKDEAQLRVDCAELAPESIRAEVRSNAAKAQEAERVPTASSFGAFDQAFCEQPFDGDACFECFCGDCGGSVDLCADDAGCRDIMTCIMESECDPTLGSGPDSCAETRACAAVINDHGGATGTSYGKFADLMGCVYAEQCPCAADPGVDPGQTCNVNTGCQQCGTCWGRCFCEGGDQNQCQEQCGDPECVPERGCSQCIDCIDYCLCNGDGDPAACTQMCLGTGDECTPDNQCNCADCFSRCACEGKSSGVCASECGGAACNPEDGCENCADCFGRCICEGGDHTSCANACPAPGSCEPANGCEGCTTCVGTCACQAELPFHECLVICDAAQCDGDLESIDCRTCDSCVSQCGCAGGRDVDCRSECVTADCSLTFSDPCEQCACDRCGFEFAACDEEPGCLELMACVTRTGCVSPIDCDRPEACQHEIQTLGGIGSPATGVAEALLSCQRVQGCSSCGGNMSVPGQAQPVQCGTEQCAAFVPPAPDPIASACCSGPAECGLDMNSIFGNVHVCAAVNSPGTVTSACPDHRPAVRPWTSTDVLLGCCRADGVCGFQDFVMNLGCAPVEVFGLSGTQPCERP